MKNSTLTLILDTLIWLILFLVQQIMCGRVETSYLLHLVLDSCNILEHQAHQVLVAL